MKNFRFKWATLMLALTATFACISLAACGDDDDIDDPAKELVGKWINYNDAYGDPWDEPFTMVLKKDGTGYISDSDGIETFSYTFDDPKLRIHWDDGGTDTFSIILQEKGFTLYGFDENDMSVLYFEKQ